MSRVLKVLLRRKLRNSLSSTKSPDESVYVKVACDFFADFFTPIISSPKTDTDQSTNVVRRFPAAAAPAKTHSITSSSLWKEQVYPLLESKFQVEAGSYHKVLTQDEICEHIFQRLQDLMNVQFTSLNSTSGVCRLNDPSIKCTIEPVVKFLQFLNSEHKTKVGDKPHYVRNPGFKQKEAEMKESILKGFDELMNEGWGVKTQPLTELRNTCCEDLFI